MTPFRVVCRCMFIFIAAMICTHISYVEFDYGQQVVRACLRTLLRLNYEILHNFVAQFSVGRVFVTIFLILLPIFHHFEPFWEHSYMLYDDTH